jgi:hypothetical protein
VELAAGVLHRSEPTFGGRGAHTSNSGRDIDAGFDDRP